MAPRIPPGVEAAFKALRYRRSPSSISSTMPPRISVHRSSFLVRSAEQLETFKQLSELSSEARA